MRSWSVFPPCGRGTAVSGPLEERDEQQFYASERLKDCQHMILRMAQSLVVQRARVEKARSAGLAAARDAYSDLQEVRGYLLEALSDVRPCLMEVEEYKLAAAAGQLHAGLAHFDLMSTAYKPVYDALCGFAGSLPVSGTTNAAVVGRLMNNIKLGYYPTDPDNIALLLRGIQFPEGVTTNLLDPCCGCGKALRQLAEGNNCFCMATRSYTAIWSSRRRNASLFKMYLPPIWPGYPIRHWQTE